MGSGRRTWVDPTRDDPVVASLSESVGGPVGTRAGRHRWWTPVRVILAMTAVCFALGMLQKSSCYDDTWQNGNARYTHMCYSDLPYLYTGRGFVEDLWPYSDDAQDRERYEVMEYPVGISYWAWWMARVTHVLNGSPDLSKRYAASPAELGGWATVQREMRIFVIVNALGFAVLALISAWLLAGVDPTRPWDAAAFALSPALLLTGLVNWDMVAVVFVAGALWAWARDRTVLTGVMIGLGTAAKLYPLFLLGGILVICVRQRRYRALAVTAASAAGSWLLVNAPAYLSGSAEWKVFWTFNSERGADLGSLWLVVQQAMDQTGDPFSFSPHTINVVTWLLFGVWCVLVALVGLRAPATPRLAQLGFLVVAGFLIFNKVYSPQYVLWLLPLAVLARPRWRDLIIWQAGEVLYFASVWWYLGGFLAPAAGGDAGFYWAATLLRVACELYLVGMVVRDLLRPAHDPVRQSRQLISTRSNAVAV
ncbi:glycosyltransferase family 87 protein [Nocardioides mangrovi]|uniref:Glycosyltransferase 87 family protein n=1 Tax=Nocardioides mangrovi TaxID=2874580 RepID=A0ABS7UBA4_9ACTN|nr:glycosyltransferase 87 family protein [Nocardioides mangrovi]MBZ5738165.1 glycosyltransferase 87 family protein [Nocardioides mangrovi]